MKFLIILVIVNLILFLIRFIRRFNSDKYDISSLYIPKFFENLKDRKILKGFTLLRRNHSFIVFSKERDAYIDNACNGLKVSVTYQADEAKQFNTAEKAKQFVLDMAKYKEPSTTTVNGEKLVKESWN